MSLEKIKKLRKERTSKIELLVQQLDKIKKDEAYSKKYKLDKESEVNNDIQFIKHEYDPQILDLIEQEEGKLLQGFYNAEYEGMENNHATKELLKEIRNQQQTEYLKRVYGNKDQNDLRNGLLKETERLVSVNSPQAPAYINAMKQLGVIGAEPLEQEYKEKNLNDLQRAYKSDLDLIREQKKRFEIEKASEDNPLKGALMEHYM